MATQTTTLRPAWRTKMVIIIIVLTAFGLWGLYDATVAYPARGEKVARLMEFSYLSRAAGPADAPREIPARTVSVDDPVRALADLQQRAKSAGVAGIDQTRLAWLQALSVVGRLAPENTTYDDTGGPRDPDVRLKELQAEWASATGQPKLLHAYDIFFQWVIFGVCWAIAAWCVFIVVRTARTKYHYDPQTKTLTLPGGATIAPGDLQDVDKRRWHKFYATLVVNDAHPTLAGRRVEVDLYRRAHIEGWVLEMEREAFPDRAEDAPDSTDAQGGPVPAGAAEDERP